MAIAALPVDRHIPASPRPWRQALTSPPVLAWAVHLLVVFATAATTVAFTPDRDGDRQRFSEPGRYLVSPLSTWDGGWYISIAERGYHGEQAAAFWPLYPLLLSFGHWLTGLPYAVVGLVLSNAALLGALIALFVLVRADYGPLIATRTVWLAALSPLAFFFSSVYTEALFLLLTVGALALARFGHWTWAALAAALAALTRSSGVFVLIPLGIMLLQQHGWRLRGWWPRAIQLSAAACAPLAFAWHLERRWDDPLLMVHSQERWGRSAGAPWDTVLKAWRLAKDRYLEGSGACDLGIDLSSLDRCRAGLQITVDALSDDLSIIAIVFAIVILPYVLWRLMPRDILYLGAGYLAPLMSPPTEDPLQSFARYLIVIFPLYIAMACLLSWRPLFVATVAVSTVALCAFLALFSQRYFVA